MKTGPTAVPAGRKLRLARHEMADTPPFLLFPGSPEEMENPAPICWQDLHGGYWAALGHRETRTVLADAHHFSTGQTVFEALLSHEAPMGAPAIPRNLDPPLHGEYRQLLSRLLALGSKRAGNSLAQSVVAEVLSSSDQNEPLDFHDKFTVPVVAKILFRVLGLPPEEEAEFAEQAILFGHYRYIGGGSRDLVVSRIQTTLPEIEHSWLYMYISRRVTCGLMGVLMSNDWNAHFSTREHETAAMFFDLVQGGLTQIPMVLRNGIQHLVANRDDLQALLADPGLARHMADEMLRLYPISTPVRTVRRDVVLADAELHVGEVVLPLLGFANRDASTFEQPHRVLLDRANPRAHLSFGTGPHRCLGAAITQDIFTASLASAERLLRNYQLLAD